MDSPMEYMRQERYRQVPTFILPVSVSSHKGSLVRVPGVGALTKINVTISNHLSSSSCFLHLVIMPKSYYNEVTISIGIYFCRSLHCCCIF